MEREDTKANARSGGPRRDVITAGLIWLVATIALEYVVGRWSIMPGQFSEEAVVVDDAFQLLMHLAVPVFTFVVVALGYSAIAYRAKDDSSDGAPAVANSRVLGSWLVITSLLAAFVFVNPGLVGLHDLRQNDAADMVIHAEARRFRWTFTYPGGEEAGDELVLPIDTRIKFEITSRDVLHSFWVPAFRMKIDAVPGRTTSVTLTPSRLGFLDEFPNLRVQCAELCGVGHNQMLTPVRVVDQDEFDAYIATLEVEG